MILFSLVINRFHDMCGGHADEQIESLMIQAKQNRKFNELSSLNLYGYSH